MTGIEKQSTADRSEQRRQQILDAAADCFQRRGFHSTSMAEVSKAAGMSVGHIYHYFENKDAVIKAMVEAKAEFVLSKMEDLRRKGDVLGALVGDIREMMQHNTDRPSAALKIEMLAEGARSPEVLETLQAVDRRAKAKFQDVLRGAYPEGCANEKTLHGITTVLSAIFEGLAIRALVSPDLDEDATIEALRRAIEGLLFGSRSAISPDCA